MVNQKRKVIYRYFKDLVGLIYPQLCLCCNEESPLDNDIFCYDCKLSMPFTDQFEVHKNAFIAKMKGRVQLERAASFLYNYKKSNVQKMLYTLKYQQKPEIGIEIGKLIGNKMNECWSDISFDQIIPIPLHPRKEQKRGYNQCQKMAEGIQETTQIKINNTCIKKVTNTDSQTSMNRSDRLHNVSQSFVLSKGPDLTGKHILIIDDVVTTGATLEVIALLCQQAQARSISFATIAMAM